MEYCKRRRKSRGCSVIWLNAQSEASVLESLRETAKILDLPDKDPIPAIKSWLSKQARLFLLLDNVTTIDSILRTIPTSGHQILMTTRDSSLVGSEMVPFGLEVDLFDREHAITLFILNCGIWNHQQQITILDGASTILSHAPSTSDSKNIQKILKSKLSISSLNQAMEELFSFTEGLPLAIIQSASYLRTYRVPFSLYIKKLKAKVPEARRDFLSHNMPGAQYNKSIMTTWDITVEELDKTNPPAKRLLTLFGFLARTHVEDAFLDTVHDDYKFWLGRGKLVLRLDLKKFFDVLNPDGFDFQESLGRLHSLSLITREKAGAKIFIHPMVHEYIHLRIPAREAAEWLKKTIGILLHRLPPLLYGSDDKNAPLDGDAVLVHLERIRELTNLYIEHMKNLSPDCAVFFLEAYLWYRGAGNLDVAEKLVKVTQRSHQGWLREAFIAAKLLDYIMEYQATVNIKDALINFRGYANIHKEETRQDYEFEDVRGTRYVLLLAVLSHRIHQALHTTPQEYFAKAVPTFSWQEKFAKTTSNSSIDRVCLAIILKSTIERIPYLDRFSLYNKRRKDALLAMQLKCSEIDGYFTSMFRRFDVSSDDYCDGGLELVRALKFAQKHKLVAKGQLDKAVESLKRLSHCPAVQDFIDSTADNGLFLDLRPERSLFASREQNQEWLQRRLRMLADDSNRDQNQVAYVNLQLAEIAAEMGRPKIDEAEQLINDLLASASDSDPLRQFTVRLRILEAFEGGKQPEKALQFCKKSIAKYLEPRRPLNWRDRRQILSWARSLLHLNDQINPMTSLQTVVATLLPGYDLTEQTPQELEDQSLQNLDYLGREIIDMAWNISPDHECDPVFLRKFCYSVRYHLEVSDAISKDRFQMWLVCCERVDMIFGKYGNSDLPLNGHVFDPWETLTTSRKFLRSYKHHGVVSAELLQLGYDESIPVQISTENNPDRMSLEVARRPSFEGLPPSLVLGAKTEIAAGCLIDPRCAVWLVSDQHPPRHILLWTRKGLHGVYYIDISREVSLKLVKRPSPYCE